MTPIRILVLVAAVALAATAQNTSSNTQATGSSGQSKGTANRPASGSANSSSSSSHKGGSNAQAPGVKLIVPPKTAQTGASTHGNSSTPASGNKGTTAATKSGAQQTVSGKTSPATATSTGTANKNTGTANKTTGAAAKSTATASGTGTANKNAGAAASQKTPVLTAKPGQKPSVSSKSASSPATTKKSAAGKAASVPNKAQVKIVPQKTAGSKKPEENTGALKVTAGGRRDPFMSIIRSLPSAPSGPGCSVGKRCLYIPELELKGIARDPDGQMLAVVVSNTHRAYFLRENDQVFNGSVQKITGDSVVFREFATDHLGRETAHEVVKRIPKS